MGRHLSSAVQTGSTCSTRSVLDTTSVTNLWRPSAGGCNGNYVGIGADDCNRAILVEQCAPYGLLIVNGEFTSFHGEDPTMVEVLASNRGCFASATVLSGSVPTDCNDQRKRYRGLLATAPSSSGAKRENTPRSRHSPAVCWYRDASFLNGSSTSRWERPWTGP
jgi:hypothetical protein